MSYKSPLILGESFKANIRQILKTNFRKGLITKEELAKRCLELTKQHN